MDERATCMWPSPQFHRIYTVNVYTHEIVNRTRATERSIERSLWSARIYLRRLLFLPFQYYFLRQFLLYYLFNWYDMISLHFRCTYIRLVGNSFTTQSKINHLSPFYHIKRTTMRYKYFILGFFSLFAFRCQPLLLSLSLSFSRFHLNAQIFGILFISFIPLWYFSCNYKSIFDRLKCI